MKILGVVLMASALVMTGSAAATNAAPARTEALAREADAFFKDQQPGGVVLVTQADQVLLRRAYGMADIEDGVAMRSASGTDASLGRAMKAISANSDQPITCRSQNLRVTASIRWRGAVLYPIRLARPAQRRREVARGCNTSRAPALRRAQS